MLRTIAYGFCATVILGTILFVSRAHLRRDEQKITRLSPTQMASIIGGNRIFSDCHDPENNCLVDCPVGGTIYKYGPWFGMCGSGIHTCNNGGTYTCYQRTYAGPSCVGGFTTTTFTKPGCP